jgi:transcriptional regulator with XRE-family HTH domain
VNHDDAQHRERLRRARKRLGISQDEMAALLLTPKSTYEQWEAGRYHAPGAAVIAAELLCELELEVAPQRQGLPSSNEFPIARSPAPKRLLADDFTNDSRRLARDRR